MQHLNFSLQLTQGYSYHFSLLHHGLLGHFPGLLAAILVETFCCYSKLKLILHKLFAQYFLARGTRLTCNTQELCEFEDRVRAWNSRASLSISRPPVYIIQIRIGWWISYVETIRIQPNTTTSNDQKPSKTQTFCCLFIDLRYAVYPSAIYPLSCLVY